VAVLNGVIGPVQSFALLLESAGRLRQDRRHHLAPDAVLECRHSLVFFKALGAVGLVNSVEVAVALFRAADAHRGGGRLALLAAVEEAAISAGVAGGSEDFFGSPEQTLEVAGRRTDGTILWMVGPRTVTEHIAPRMTEAAAAAGRGAPRIVCSLPTCVTDDAEAVRSAAATVFEIYGQLPSYRAMLDREGARHPGDVAIIGTEEEVAQQLAGLADAGVTDFSALEFGTSTDEFTRTRALLKSLL